MELQEKIAIADLWRDHYESLLNDSTHHDEKADVLQSFNNISLYMLTCRHVCNNE